MTTIESQAASSCFPVSYLHLDYRNSFEVQSMYSRAQMRSLG